jgi:hypothetical protein
MKKKAKNKPKQGTARMKELGYVPVQLWLNQEEKRFLQALASARAVTLAGAITNAAVRAATEFLGVSLRDFKPKAS